MSTGDRMILSAVCFLLPCIIQAKSKFKWLHIICGWLGPAMVLGSFQCRGGGGGVLWFAYIWRIKIVLIKYQKSFPYRMVDVLTSLFKMNGNKLYCTSFWKFKLKHFIEGWLVDYRKYTIIILSVHWSTICNPRATTGKEWHGVVPCLSFIKTNLHGNITGREVRSNYVDDLESIFKKADLHSWTIQWIHTKLGVLG